MAAAALALALAGPALAQGTDGPGRGARGERGEPLRALIQHREELKLTDRQVASIQAIAARLERTEQTLRAKLDAAGLQRPEGRGERARPSEQERARMRQQREQLRPVFQQMREARQGAMKEVQQVLTPEQRQQVAARLQERQGRRQAARDRGARRGSGPAGARGEVARRAPLEALIAHRQELELTDGQVAKLEAIRAEFRKRNQPLMEKLRAAGVGAGDRAARPTPEQREALRPTMEQLRENAQEAMKEVRGVLTKEQQARLRSQLREQRGERSPRRG
jgi:Spy/CpxP family protein refolding chaperone